MKLKLSPAKKAWVTRKRNQEIAKQVRRFAALKAWNTRRMNALKAA